MDRKPTPVCPVPIEVGSNDVSAGQYDGVDILAVVDNSKSMTEEQQILAAGFFTLINSLVHPPSGWPFPTVTNVRVAVVSSDLGLQYGDARDTRLSPSVPDSPSCDENNSRGGDGRFLPISVLGNVATVIGRQIPCEDAGSQCPPDYTCEQGRCRSTDGSDLMVCPTLDTPFAETSDAVSNAFFTAQTACMALQGTDGCAFEQQLEAAVRGLEREENKSFIKDSHLLAVLYVSDEEDCSMKDEGIFVTPEWSTPLDRNLACNRNAANESHLFETSRYREKLIGMKKNKADAVLFAAIVGVPIGGICEGSGRQLIDNGCLSHPDMKLTEEEMPAGGNFFRPACTRTDADGAMLTEARPGRRFVEVAQSFDELGYVYSICNEDWSPAMVKIAGIIAEQIQPPCFAKKLEWEMLDEAEAAKYPNCENCGFAACSAVMEHFIPVDNTTAELCPASLYAGLSEAEASRYLEQTTIQEVVLGGQATGRRVICPVPKLPAALDCAAAAKGVAERFTGMSGWYYCEVGEDDASNMCTDGQDNNNNGTMDCEDATCRSCTACGGSDPRCVEGCPYRAVFTETAQRASTQGKLGIQCMQQFTFEDENCREDSPVVCGDGKDNDGNGVYDCDNTLYTGAEDAHQPDPNCCPMTEEGGKCIPDMERLWANCKTSAALAGAAAFDISAASQVDACRERAAQLGCAW